MARTEGPSRREVLIANQAESEWNEHVRIEERRFMQVEKSVCDVPQLPQEMKIIFWSAQNLGTGKTKQLDKSLLPSKWYTAARPVNFRASA